MIELIREKSYEVLGSIGIYIDKDIDTEDLDLREYIADSLEFMSMIIAFEDKFEISFPTEVLNFESIASFNTFLSVIEELYNTEIGIL
ncbi:phosphopantetheine-binding protein [Niameybacter sp.]|uniref:phosphopantetheine-binding protein n=1 Tax=Niameybacter sp. TaxID=2033640 RepID=UPI002FC5CB93